MKKNVIIDFSTLKRIHFVGIKGIAMCALAVWAKEQGVVVSGSDIPEFFPSVPILKNAGIEVFNGFSAERYSEMNTPPDLVVYTGAHGGKGNIEVITATALQIPVLPHGKALGLAMAAKEQISVAGCHGKTTTSAMIATILMHAKADPSYAIGSGDIRGLGAPGHCGTGRYFVAEADEYITDPTGDFTPRFLWQKPEYLVVTNIDYDHPDAYPDLNAVQNAFKELQNQQTGKKVTIMNADNAESGILVTGQSGCTILTYGQSEDAMYRIVDIRYGSGKTVFSLTHKNRVLGDIELAVPGEHNVLNAAASCVLAMSIGITWEKIREGLLAFGGAKRRFEKIGESHGILYFDDYAHHPKEIQATLSASRKWFPEKRILVVFQPHTYSRTRSLLSDFSRAFGASDVVILTDIYASARETETFGISGETLFSEMKKFHPVVYYSAGKNEVLATLKTIQKTGDVILFMGAGDIYSWEQDLLKKLYE